MPEKIAKLRLDDGKISCVIMLSNDFYLGEIRQDVGSSIISLGYDLVNYGAGIHTLILSNENKLKLHIIESTIGSLTFYDVVVTLLDKYDNIIIRDWTTAFNGEQLYIGFLSDDQLKQAGICVVSRTLEPDIPIRGEYCSSSISLDSEQRERLYRWLKGSGDSSTDPYDPDPGPPEPNPDPDPPTELIPVPDLPDLSATDTGFLTLYNPTVSQLRSLANYMWSDLFSLDTLKKLFADPMEAIIGCAIVPCDVPSGGTREVKVGNIGTGVSMTVATSQYQRVRCGSVKIPKHWDGYMDYSPYTKLQIFLPYIGFRQLNIDECMGKDLGVEYHVDCLTGACTAYVTCNNSVFYEYSGQCSVTVPFSGSNWNSAIQSAVSVGAVVGGAVATVASGGAAAPAIAAAGATTVGAVVSNKEDINKSGSMGGGAGILGNQKPFICLIRPNQCVPANQNRFTGYPSYRTVSLGSITGFTVVQEIHLENLTATDVEKMEIESKLKSGVIL